MQCCPHFVSCVFSHSSGIVIKCDERRDAAVDKTDCVQMNLARLISFLSAAAYKTTRRGTEISFASNNYLIEISNLHNFNDKSCVSLYIHLQWRNSPNQMIYDVCAQNFSKLYKTRNSPRGCLIMNLKTVVFRAKWKVVSVACRVCAPVPFRR